MVEQAEMLGSALLALMCCYCPVALPEPAWAR